MAAAPFPDGGGEQRTRPPAVTPGLSGEQVQVLSLLARGEDFPQIAKQLGITVRDARGHLRDAMQTLGARNPTHAVALAIGHRLLPANIATHPQET